MRSRRSVSSPDRVSEVSERRSRPRASATSSMSALHGNHRVTGTFNQKRRRAISKVSRVLYVTRNRVRATQLVTDVLLTMVVFTPRLSRRARIARFKRSPRSISAMRTFRTCVATPVPALPHRAVGPLDAHGRPVAPLAGTNEWCRRLRVRCRRRARARIERIGGASLLPWAAPSTQCETTRLPH
jgi:hypothetical protein